MAHLQCWAGSALGYPVTPLPSSPPAPTFEASKHGRSRSMASRRGIPCETMTIMDAEVGEWIRRLPDCGWANGTPTARVRMAYGTNHHGAGGSSRSSAGPPGIESALSRYPGYLMIMRVKGLRIEAADAIRNAGRTAATKQKGPESSRDGRPVVAGHDPCCRSVDNCVSGKEPARPVPYRRTGRSR
jgi:hypothetical protein